MAFGADKIANLVSDNANLSVESVVANTCLSSKVSGGPESPELLHMSQLAIEACQYGILTDEMSLKSRAQLSLIRYFHLSGSFFQSRVIRGFIFKKARKFSCSTVYHPTNSTCSPNSVATAPFIARIYAF